MASHCGPQYNTVAPSEQATWQLDIRRMLSNEQLAPVIYVGGLRLALALSVAARQPLHI